MALTTREIFVQDIAQILADYFGDSGALQSYNFEVAEQIATATEDEDYARLMVNNIVYTMYMDAVAAGEIAAAVDTLLDKNE